MRNEHYWIHDIAKLTIDSDCNTWACPTSKNILYGKFSGKPAHVGIG
jgi:hypothetical protein